MGVREIDRCLEKWRMEVKDLRQHDPGADAQGAGEVVRRAAAGPGLDQRPRRAGKGPTHYWPMGVGLEGLQP